jgi:hypothetical protein
VKKSFIADTQEEAVLLQAKEIVQ